MEFPLEFLKPFSLAFFMLEKSCVFLFVSPDNAPGSLFRRYWSVFIMVPCSTLYFITQSIFFIKLVAKGDDFPQIMQAVPVVTVTIQVLFKIIFFIPKRKQIGDLIQEIASFWPSDDDLLAEQVPIKHKNLKRLNFYVNFFYWLNTVGIWQYMLTPLLEVVFRRSVLNEDVNFMLPFGCSLPFDQTQSWTTYLCVYLFQVYGSALDGFFNKIIFVNLLFATITICFFGFVAKVVSGPGEIAKNFVGVVASTLPIFNLCYYGHSLSEASAGIGVAAYNNIWYKGDRDYKRNILFMIFRSLKPCAVTSLKYTPVTLNTFTTVSNITDQEERKVLSTTWSYFSLMSSVYNSEEKTIKG